MTINELFLKLYSQKQLFFGKFQSFIKIDEHHVKKILSCFENVELFSIVRSNRNGEAVLANIR